MGAIQRQQQTEAKYKEKSASLAKEQLEKLSEQMELFRVKLQDFSVKHKKDIKKDANFRRAFQSMCANVGVDPLQSSTNFWSKMLGVGDIYYELAIQLIEICLALNDRTGGVMDIHELHTRLLMSRTVSKSTVASEVSDISVHDLIKAIEKISILGNGIQLIKCDKTYLVKSMTSELNMDQNEVIKLAQTNQGKVSLRDLQTKLNWSTTRSETAINNLVMEGVVWVDDAGNGQAASYWLPGLFNSAN